MYCSGAGALHNLVMNEDNRNETVEAGGAKARVGYMNKFVEYNFKFNERIGQKACNTTQNWIFYDFYVYRIR